MATPPKGLGDFFKSNASVGGKLGAGLMAAELLGAESKLKSLANIAMMAVTPAFAALGVRGFKAAGDAARSLIKETGSLDAALRKIGKSAEDAQEALAKAKETMKATAGAPWAEAEIANTKNMTRATQALTPTVGALSAAWQKLTGGFSVLKSEFIAYHAEAGTLGAAMKTLNGILQGTALAVTALSAGILVKWLSGAAAAAKATTATFTAWAASAGYAGTMLEKAGKILLRFVYIAARFTGWGLIVSGLAAVAGMAYRFANASSEAANAALRMANATMESTGALMNQISQVRTAEDHINAYRAAIENLIKAQEQLNDLHARGIDKDDSRYVAAQNAVAAAKSGVKAAAGKKPFEGPGSGEEKAAYNQQVATMLRDDAERAAMEAAANNPERQVELMKEAAAKAGERASAGEKEIAEKEKTEKEIAGIGEEEARRRLVPEARKEEIAKLTRMLSGGDEEFGKKIIEERMLDPKGAKEKLVKMRERLSDLRAKESRGEDQYDPSYYEGLRKEAKRSSGSALYQGEAESNPEKIAKAKALAQEAASNRQKEAGLKAAADLQERRIAMDRIDANLGSDLLKIKETGFIQEEKENEVKMKSFADERMALETSNAGAGAITEFETRVRSEEKSWAIRKAQIELSREELRLEGEIAGKQYDGFMVEMKSLQIKEEMLKRRIASNIPQEEKDRLGGDLKNTQAEIAQSAIRRNNEMRALGMEEKSVNLRSVGFQRSKQEQKIKLDGINAELAALNARGVKTEAQARRERELNAEKSRLAEQVGLTEQERLSTRIDMGLELKSSRARMTGDAAGMMEAENLSSFKSKFDSLKNVIGIDAAGAHAQQLGRDAISFNLRQAANAMTHSTAASSLAAIGAGGNVADGSSDPLLTSTKAIEKFMKESVEIMKAEAEARKSGSSLRN